MPKVTSLGMLLVAIALEVTAQTFLKISNFWSRLLPSILTIVFFASQFLLYSFVISRIDISKAYPIWSGLGTTAMAVVGYLVFKENLSLARCFFIGLIIVGVSGLHLAK